MHLSVYSLKKILYEGEARLLNCQTVSGEITILNHHRPIISELKSGVLKILDESGKEHYFNLNSGFLEVNAQNQVRLLVDEG